MLIQVYLVAMAQEPKPIEPSNLIGRAQISLTVKENWLAALSGKLPEDQE